MKNLRQYIRALIKEAMLNPSVFSQDEIPESMITGDEDIKQTISDFSKTDFRSAAELADSLDASPAVVAAGGGYDELRAKGKKIKHAHDIADKIIGYINFLHHTLFLLKKQNKRAQNVDWTFSQVFNLLDITKQKAQDGMPIEMVFDYVLHGAASLLEKLHNNLGCCETDIYDAFDILLINLTAVTKKAFANEPTKLKAILAKQQSDKFRYYIPLNPKLQTP